MEGAWTITIWLQAETTAIKFNDSSDDFLPIVYEIEEIDCRMTDMEERDKNDQNAGNSNRSVRGSLFNSPKDFPIIIPSNKINES